MASPETTREYSQDNKKENFSSQEAERTIQDSRKELSDLKFDVLNAGKKVEAKGWSITELEKASELIGDFYEIKKDPNSANLNNEVVVFNLDSVKAYLETLHKRLSVKGAPGYTAMSKEKIFGATVLALQIALEAIYRPAPQIGTYDVGVISGKLDGNTEKVIRDFQRDFIGGKGVDGKPGKTTIGMIIKKLGDKYATINTSKKDFKLGFKEKPVDRVPEVVGFRGAFTTAELKNRLQKESDTDYKKYGTTKAVRTNNPGNIQDKKWGDDYIDGCIGYEQSKRGKFTVFNTPQDGWNALVEKIKRIQSGLSKVYHPNDTIRQYFKRYDPSNPNYPVKVAGQLGVNVNTKIGALDPEKFASIISQNEDGAMYKKLRDKNIITDDIINRKGTKKS